MRVLEILKIYIYICLVYIYIRQISWCVSDKFVHNITEFSRFSFMVCCCYRGCDFALGERGLGFKSQTSLCLMLKELSLSDAWVSPWLNFPWSRCLTLIAPWQHQKDNLPRGLVQCLSESDKPSFTVLSEQLHSYNTHDNNLDHPMFSLSLWWFIMNSCVCGFTDSKIQSFDCYSSYMRMKQNDKMRMKLRLTANKWI